MEAVPDAGAVLAGFGAVSRINGSRRNGGLWNVYRGTSSLGPSLEFLERLVHPLVSWTPIVTPNGTLFEECFERAYSIGYYNRDKLTKYPNLHLVDIQNQTW